MGLPFSEQIPALQGTKTAVSECLRHCTQQHLAAGGIRPKWVRLEGDVCGCALCQWACRPQSKHLQPRASVQYSVHICVTIHLQQKAVQYYGPFSVTECKHLTLLPLTRGLKLTVSFIETSHGSDDGAPLLTSACGSSATAYSDTSLDLETVSLLWHCLPLHVAPQPWDGSPRPRSCRPLQ